MKILQEITLKLPDNIFINPVEIKIILGAKLYESGKLSLGQAADVAGLSKRAFIEILGVYGVSVFNYNTSDLEADISNA